MSRGNFLVKTNIICGEGEGVKKTETIIALWNGLVTLKYERLCVLLLLQKGRRCQAKVF